MSSHEKPGLWRVGTPALIIALLVMVVGWFVANPPSVFETPEEESAPTRQTTEVRNADLTRSFEADGNLQFSDDRTILHPTTGTITAVAAPGTPVSSGDVLYAVDGVPTIALHGETPAWRTMDVDSVGNDVVQLEAALADLGYDTAGVLAIDGTYTDYTAELVTRWQSDLGTEETGRVEHGTVVFITPGAQVGTVAAVRGQAVPPEGMLQLHSATRSVEIQVDVADIASIEVGDTLSAQLPDRTLFDVVVTDLRPLGSGVWSVTANPVETPSDALLADEVPVDISWTESIGEGVVVVPAAAIKRLDSGDYVVEVENGSTHETEFVPIEIGTQSGSLVEILSPLEVGTTIIAT